MDLPTHFAFAFAIGLLFFDKPEIALLIALGAVFPDLDREYWFMPKKRYADEQIHRAGLHNVFIMGLAYIISPFFSLGIFLHMLQDSFTTVKDRGVEWFYPITRLVKRGLFDASGNKEPVDPNEKIYFYQEDSRGLVDKADPDLREYGCDPVPWRRVYGFAQNSKILDRAFLYTSIVIILVWNFAPGNYVHLLSWTFASTGYYVMILIAYISVAALFIAGELDRHSEIHPHKNIKFDFIKYPIFGIGLMLFIIWIVLFREQILQNIFLNVLSNPIALGLEVIAAPLVILFMVKQKTKDNKPAVV